MSLLETLHRKRINTRPQLKVFYWAFGLIFVWEVFPEYIIGNGNEGLEFLSLCFDFQYIGSSALYLPLLVRVALLLGQEATIANVYRSRLTFIGYVLNIVVFLGLYYSNIWRARDFPFLSQLLFSPSSNSTL